MRSAALAAAAVAACSLGAACFEPEAFIHQGGSGGGGGPPALNVPVAPEVALPVSAPASVAPTGTAMQRHLVYAGGVWWFFYLTDGGVTFSSSSDFQTWQPAPGPASLLALDVAVFDGRLFGVDTQPIDTSTDIVHFGLTGVSGTGAVRQHGRAVVLLGKLQFDPSVVVVDAGAPQHLPDGTVTLVGDESPPLIHDYASGSTPSAACGTCTETSVNADDGGAWSGGFGAPVSLDMPGSAHDVRLRGAMSLHGTPVTVWRDAQTLRYASVLDPSHIADGSLGQDDAGAPDARTFAICAEPSFPQYPNMGHMLEWTPGGFTHRTTGDGAYWQRRAPPDAPFSQDLTELFLACGPDSAYAFTIDPSDGRIVVARWDPVTFWSAWTTAVGPAPAGTPRCFLSGFERQSELGIGIVWTEGAGCTGPQASVEVHGAFVSVPE